MHELRRNERVLLMLLLGLDFESTGLDLVNDRVIEVGMVMWDSELRQPTRLEGFLVKPNDAIDPKHWAEAEKIHGIAWDTVDRYGMPDARAFAVVDTWLHTAEVVVAHNGCIFDRPMFEAWATRRGEPVVKRLWIDTRMDLPRPLTGKLIYLAAEFGFVNPFPHRALFDAMSMMRILDNFDVQAVIARAKLPSVLVQARVNYSDREKAKDRGYYWESEKKRWVRTFKETEIEQEKIDAGFPIQVVQML